MIFYSVNDPKLDPNEETYLESDELTSIPIKPVILDIFDIFNKDKEYKIEFRYEYVDSTDGGLFLVATYEDEEYRQSIEPEEFFNIIIECTKEYITIESHDKIKALIDKATEYFKNIIDMFEVNKVYNVQGHIYDEKNNKIGTYDSIKFCKLAKFSISSNKNEEIELHNCVCDYINKIKYIKIFIDKDEYKLILDPHEDNDEDNNINTTVRKLYQNLIFKIDSVEKTKETREKTKDIKNIEYRIFDNIDIDESNETSIINFYENRRNTFIDPEKIKRELSEFATIFDELL